MGHIGKEFCFRTICIFCGPVSLFQCLTGFNLCFLLLCHIHGCQQYLFQLSILPFQGNIRSDFISLFIQAAILKLINIIFTFQFFPNIIRGYQDIYSFQWFQCFIFFKNLHLKIMIKSQRFIYHLSIQIVEFISVIFQITDNKAVNQTHNTLNQLLHGSIIRCHLQMPCALYLCLCDITQKDHGIF